MQKMVILADDLSGAADCGIACVQAGLSTCVVMGEASAPEVEVLSIDADTRAKSPELARSVVRDALARHLQDAGTLLYKKIDSTLRGHLKEELAVTFETLRSLGRHHPLAIFAPAFPASGRTTSGGFQFVQGQVLHETEIWKREGISGRAFLPEMLSGVGLQPALLDLSAIRAGKEQLRAAMLELAARANILICDAETQADLQAIAAASFGLEDVFWVGSAGLAHALPSAAGLVQKRDTVSASRIASPGPAIIAVGSLSRASRQQAEQLATMPDVVSLEIAPETLLAGPGSWAEISAAVGSALTAGKDVLLVLADNGTVDLRQAPALAANIGSLLVPFASAAGALVATGGETARAILEAWQVNHLHLRQEFEPGLPLSTVEAGGRTLPVFTKAGGFGGPDTLAHCLEFLRTVRFQEESASVS